MVLKNVMVRSLLYRTNNSAIYQQIRHSPRYTYRRPKDIIAAEDYNEIADKRQTTSEFQDDTESPSNTPKPLKINWEQSRSRLQAFNKTENIVKKPLEYSIKTSVKPLTVKRVQPSAQKSVDMLETTIDEEGNFIYKKMENNDRRISKILIEVKSKKEKTKKDLMLLEGKRLIKEALEARCKLEYILFSRMKELQYLKPYLPKIGARLYKMPYREMELWSDLTTNPGIMGVFKIPDRETCEMDNVLPLRILCDNVREPNNLGAVLRTSSGVGCEEVLLTKGCTNLWDTKVLRTACGGHFKLRLRSHLELDNIRKEITSEAKICIADNNMFASGNKDCSSNLQKLVNSIPIVPYYSVNFAELNSIVLIVGGETEGISEESYQLAAEMNGVRLHIPLNNNVDSLNIGTALGVIAFEIKKQLLLSGKYT